MKTRSQVASLAECFETLEEARGFITCLKSVFDQVKQERDEAREQLAQAGVGPYVGDYYLGKLTVTGQLRADKARLREALNSVLSWGDFTPDWADDKAKAEYRRDLAQARATLAQTGGAS